MRRFFWKGASVFFGILAGCPIDKGETTDYTGMPADYEVDDDGDGYSDADGDCDDDDAAVSPEAAEICDDGIDNNCDDDVDGDDADCVGG